MKIYVNYQLRPSIESAGVINYSPVSNYQPYLASCVLCVDLTARKNIQLQTALSALS